MWHVWVRGVGVWGLGGNWREGDHWGDIGIDGLGMWRVWLRIGEGIGSWRGNWREGDHWGDLGIDGPGMWHVWVRRGGVYGLGGETGGKETTGGT